MRYRTERTPSIRTASSLLSGMRYGMCASTIFLFARTMRCATVASEMRNALAISEVVKPTTARSVSATRASCDSAGWQHVNSSRRRSSASAWSDRKSDCSRSASFSRYLLSRRRTSMARRLAVVVNHAPGLSGMPCCGHFSSATTRLSCTTSSARSKSPMARTSAPVSRPASSRKTAATAASVRVCSAVLVVDDRPDLDSVVAAAGPRLGHRERLVEILHLDDREPSDDLFGLDERAVGDGDLAVPDADGRRAARALELRTADDPAGGAVLFPPLHDAPVGGGLLLLGHLVPRLLVSGAARKHEYVLHRDSPTGGPRCRFIDTTNRTGPFRQLSGARELGLLLREEAHDSDRGVVAQGGARKV